MAPKTKEMAIPSSIHSLKPVRQKRGKDVYADNPFLEGFYISTRKKNLTVAAGLSVIKDSNGDDVAAGAVAMYQEVDSDSFLKLYISNIKMFFDLSQTAQKVLLPLLIEIQKEAKNVAHVFFSHHEASENSKMAGEPHISESTYRRGLNELIAKGFLAVNAKGPNWYWINPNVIFNGDRVRFVKEYRLIRDKEIKKEIEQASLLSQN